MCRYFAQGASSRIIWPRDAIAGRRNGYHFPGRAEVSHYMAARCHCRGYPIFPFAAQVYFALCERFFFLIDLPPGRGAFCEPPFLQPIKLIIVFAEASDPR